jgi:hypothetical protein
LHHAAHDRSDDRHRQDGGRLQIGRTYYVQRPRAGADQLDDDDILVTRLTTSELCSIDTVQLHDRVTGFWHGFLTLDKFVPYAKPRTK